MELSEGTVLRVGSLGEIPFKKGFYAYVGSAMGGIGGRVGRHLRREKRKRWHIDHLLERARIREVMVAKGRGDQECLLAEALRERLEAVPRFGASDCRCGGHLFFCEDWQGLKRACIQAAGGLSLDFYWMKT